MGLHPGEVAVQRRSGVTKLLGSARARPEVPPVAREFLERQRMLFIGAADGRGAVWAALLTGEPGFLSADEGTLLVRGAGELSWLADGQEIGTIAIDPATRRRMRVNGRASWSADGLVIETDQVVSNCPKYLQVRHLAEVEGEVAPQVSHADELDDDLVAWIGAADTFFLATQVPGQGADVSHRGGNPGFVQVGGPRRLRWPDYPGNFMFLTLGNLELNPAAGLLFLDWERGHTLQLSGQARTVESEDGRWLEFDIERVVVTRHASPLRWEFGEYSPFNP